jgi:hypothetical protein
VNSCPMCLQGGVGLRIASLVEMQTAILRLYAPLIAFNGSGSGTAGGGHRASLHGGGSGAISHDDSAVAPSEQSPPTAASAAETAQAAAPAASSLLEPDTLLAAPGADVRSRSGHAPDAAGNRLRAAHRLSEVRLITQSLVRQPEVQGHYERHTLEYACPWLMKRC